VFTGFHDSSRTTVRQPRPTNQAETCHTGALFSLPQHYPVRPSVRPPSRQTTILTYNFNRCSVCVCQMSIYQSTKGKGPIHRHGAQSRATHTQAERRHIPAPPRGVGVENPLSLCVFDNLHTPYAAVRHTQITHHTHKIKLNKKKAIEPQSINQSQQNPHKATNGHKDTNGPGARRSPSLTNDQTTAPNTVVVF